LSLVITGDGSPTLFCEAVSEHYHSTRDGAFAEALHKHVGPAWEYRIRGRAEVVVVDLCFGLGYNTLVLLWLLRRKGFAGRLRVFSPERDAALLARLDSFPYPEQLAGLRPVIKSLASRRLWADRDWRVEIAVGEARSFLAGRRGPVDIIFHDPFSPQHNPALWTREFFAEYRRLGAADLLVTTYSAATAVRLGLYENGFRIYQHRPAARVRSSTLATLGRLPGTAIDMELKKKRNPAAASLRD
jgi:tRNA U34 5-methylaminomethyl-2-thiouridine-forming methyltransferase MnmC